MAETAVKHRIIDVSSNQSGVNFSKVAAAGIFGAYIKATEGASYVDPGHWVGRTPVGSFKDKERAARAAKLKVGFYHFARPDNNHASDEVHNFIQHAGIPRKGDLVPVLDLEQAGHKYEPNPVAWARDFCRRYHDRTGVWPLFYSYPYFIEEYLSPSYPIGGGLWLASYGPNDGQRHKVSVPAPWKKLRLHQYTSQGSVPGVSGHVDLSYAADPTTLLVR